MGICYCIGVCADRDEPGNFGSLNQDITWNRNVLIFSYVNKLYAGYCYDRGDICLDSIFGIDYENCIEWTCAEGFWKCDNLFCILEKDVCDGKEECNDASDEKGIKKFGEHCGKII